MWLSSSTFLTGLDILGTRYHQPLADASRKLRRGINRGIRIIVRTGLGLLGASLLVTGLARLISGDMLQLQVVPAVSAPPSQSPSPPPLPLSTSRSTHTSVPLSGDIKHFHHQAGQHIIKFCQYLSINLQQTNLIYDSLSSNWRNYFTLARFKNISNFNSPFPPVVPLAASEARHANSGGSLTSRSLFRWILPFIEMKGGFNILCIQLKRLHWDIFNYSFLHPPKIDFPANSTYEKNELTDEDSASFFDGLRDTFRKKGHDLTQLYLDFNVAFGIGKHIYNYLSLPLTTSTSPNNPDNP